MLVESFPNMYLHFEPAGSTVDISSRKFGCLSRIINCLLKIYCLLEEFTTAIFLFKDLQTLSQV